jgi:NADH-quinone oxidoreductase subunit N
MVPDLSNLLSHFGAEVVLALAIPAILIADLVGVRGRRGANASAVGLLALAAALLLALFQDAGSGVLLTKLLVADGLAKVFRLLAIGTGLIAALAALRWGDAETGRAEFFVCLIGAVLGACLTAAANDLAMLYIAIETLSIGGYLLAGFRKASAKGSEAALKYVIFGAVSSGAMLYGMSLLYGFAGTATITTPHGASFASLAGAAGGAASQPAFLVAVVLVFAGLAYKVAAAPFQFWCPDVYEGAPTSVAAFLAVASKGAGFAAILRFVGAVTAGATPDIALTAEHVRILLLGMALLTMTVGNVAALRQNNAKRLLAYSAIAHAGYLLMGVSVTTAAGATAVIFYMAVYLFMTLGAFYMVGVVERETGRGDLEAFEGLGFRAPLFGVCMAIAMIGLTGLPPTAGFVGKYFLLQQVFAYGGAHGSMLFFWGGVIALLNTVVSLGYYAKFLKVMYLCDLERMPKTPFRFAGVDKGLVVALMVPVLVFGILFSGLYDAASDLARGIFLAAGVGQ